MAYANSKLSDTGSLVYVVAEIDSDHPVPESWNSDDASAGYARILINADTLEILRMEMLVNGVFVPGSAGNTLQNNVAAAQPFHFHNKPQGSPSFFVEQLFDYDSSAGEISTAELINTAQGFSFVIDSPYSLRNPINKPELGADFVIDEVRAGNGYLGLHTASLSIPATALAGDLLVLADGSINGKVQWLDSADNVAAGSARNDLLSLGDGNDKGIGGNGNDVLDGGGGRDALFGGRGDDALWGANRRDVLHGGIGDDRLFGGLGGDWLIGDGGDDILSGGLGRDVFVFRANSDHDTITDFVLGKDVIQFVGAQRLITSSLRDLDGEGIANDTLLTLVGGELTVLNADLTGSIDWLQSGPGAAPLIG